MTPWVPAIAICGIGVMLLGLGILLWVRLNGYRRSSARGTAAAGEFSPARFDPMTRLLGDEDLEFLRQFSNCKPELAKQWERERRQIFRLYLREAATEFQRLHAAARLLAANAPEEHADLVGKLMRQQVTFWSTLAKIELRLALGELPLGGLGLGKIDVRKIVALIEAMQADVRPGLVQASV